ncbi:metal ABC transporter ATP-binding protein [Aerococcus kribbianus]|uniref:Metal ABC transporter ATP-binding protein n=1 Tax=Aerococcus kribbianus TaxID=2999064 RepID=A0A9X3FN85_9LACT|nr:MULTISPECIES: metal ABC transporter ATP-binding protein [unclassified Aerococcus]MCZ0716873.1 metal ABC transporter ATP-binding protein [Aerococcus sp. YH-aer221]MCZ0725161.1 metal ABC transporter ATP-binding protein [Aerococcus sp. YH-aer222]
MLAETAIKIKDLTVAYHGDPVLYNISTEFYYGNRTAIVGPNGAGKSTLLKASLGLTKSLTGQANFYIQGKALNIDQAYKHIAFVPQAQSVDWTFPASVFDVVLMGRYGHLGLGKRPRKADKDIATKNLEKVGLTDFKDRQIAQLSGGQRQRVFLARAFCQEADIIILDEPLAGVDIKTEEIIMDLLSQEAKTGKAIIAVHHDLNTVSQYFDRVLMMNRELIASGPVDQCLTPETIQSAYSQSQGPVQSREGSVDL